jgi:hypothetical protein
VDKFMCHGKKERRRIIIIIIRRRRRRKRRNGAKTISLQTLFVRLNDNMNLSTADLKNYWTVFHEI